MACMSLVATTSVRKLLLLLVGCAVAVTLGVWMVQSPLQDRREESLFGGWLCIVFFGLGGIVALVQLVVARPRLTIDSYGITWTQRSDQPIPWSAISDIDLLKVSRSGYFLRLWLVDADHYPPTRRPKRPGPSLSTRMYGGDVFIQLSVLDTSAKKVMGAVDQYWHPRQR
jgi:hypothetical protein